MANQKQHGGGLTWREVGPGNSEGGVRSARAPRPRPSGSRLSDCQTAAGAKVPAEELEGHCLERRLLRDCTARVHLKLGWTGREKV
jgi:hypothetical protein